MNDTRQGLLPIGAFAAASRLSLKALRLYAQLGILVPSYVDPDSSYRYYHADQLGQARLIRTLRQIDMPLATIRQVLAAAPADAERIVLGHVQAIEARLVQARRVVHNLMPFLRKEVQPMGLDVYVQTVAPQPIVSINKRIKVDQLDRHIRASVDQLSALIESQGGMPAGAPFGIFHGPINHEEDGPLEVCMPIQQPISAAGEAVVSELPGGKLACVMAIGDQCDFPAILAAYDTASDWIRTNGYEMAGSPREIWHSKPGEQDRMEIAWPFKEP
jgi:DNA-binding transcriptional MerR regulator